MINSSALSFEESAQRWRSELSALASAEKAAIYARFFKTGKGEYGYGDRFIGVTVPDNRRVSVAHRDDPIEVICLMLQSPEHEYRLAALLALVERYRRSRDFAERQNVVAFYLANLQWINNWDLVDLSVYKILGEWLVEFPDSELLDRLAADENMWVQRVAIVATMALLRRGRFDDTIRLARRFISHKHPLIHKASGWLLREVGKRDEQVLIDFLDEHATAMPRTMLRYSIERLSPSLRRHYLTLK